MHSLAKEEFIVKENSFGMEKFIVHHQTKSFDMASQVTCKLHRGMLSNSLLGGANTERSKGISASPSMLPKCTPILTSQLLWNCVNVTYVRDSYTTTIHLNSSIIAVFIIRIQLVLPVVVVDEKEDLAQVMKSGSV
ncbi:hypothetical protein C5167_032264 [Papaver somniferum]|uniref:Uncharacterized protein n=1 Tax=Papaver somniferum TaxID=3469 RepID=A0A4Y7KAZ6_PAPSO|nr:hypothetical protein C5167_032264 [Papaver somniferum]